MSDLKQTDESRASSTKGGSTMGSETKKHISGLLLSNKKHTKYLYILACLAIVVVFGVAMSLRQNGRAATHEEQVLDCHYAGNGAHTHDESCYDKDGNLVCPLPERELHTHTDDCYSIEEELVCGKEEYEGHIHTDECYDEDGNLICGLEEFTGHEHTDDCYDEEGNLICGLEEREVHTHTDDCYKTVKTLTCGKEELTEEHVHGQGCFTTITVPDDEEEIEEEEEEEIISEDGVEYPEQVFQETVDLAGNTKDDEDDLTVRVDAPNGALPEGTTMKVKVVTSDKYVDSAKQEVEDKRKSEVETVQAVDIAFIYEGEEIEPMKDVHVSMRYQGVEFTQNSAIEVVHVDDDYNAQIVGQKDEETEKDEVTFESNRFSVYAIVITTQHISSTGDVYDVTVSYGPDAKIPEGAKVRVREFSEGSRDYVYARYSVLAAKQADGESVDIDSFNLAALDISIIDSDGNEIEPSDKVKVDLKIKSLPDVDNLDEVVDSLEVQHHVETGDGVIVQTVAGGDTEASFNVPTDERIISVNQDKIVDPNSITDEDVDSYAAEQAAEVETSFETEVFSTFTVTWRNNARKITVRYEDESGKELTVANTNTYNNTVIGDLYADSDSPAFLIYDIDGYEYSYTYRNNKNTKIEPMLSKKDNKWRYTSNASGDSVSKDPSWTELENKDVVHVVYKPKADTTTGGTAQLDINEVWPEGDDAPQFSKSSTNNGDGTNTISLSIEAGEKPVEKSTPADVIVVLDVSGSMNYEIGNDTTPSNSNNSRIAKAKAAVNNMANMLIGTNSNNGDVRMALVTFSNEAQLVQGFTNNYSTFTSKVNGLSADGGTNWEEALQKANTMDVRSNAATYIVFVTDGDPTWRISRGDVTNQKLDMYSSSTYIYYRKYEVFGEGNDDSAGLNFDYAVKQVQSIVGSNKNFYTIGISSQVTKVENLVTEGGTTADHAFLATNENAMNNAFNSITQSISSDLGFGNVAITDGITALTHAEMKVMDTVDPASFTYYRYGGANNKYGADYDHKTKWETRAADGCGEAGYSKTTGCVIWNMGEKFQLEDNVTYVVTFRVWPSQDAYDLVADLNNGVKTFASLTAGEKAQVVELKAPTEKEQGSYALKTNTDEVNATYNKTSKSGSVITVADTTSIPATYHEGLIQDMALESMKLTVKKTFEDDLTAGEDRQTEVRLHFLRRDAHPEGQTFLGYSVPQADGASSEYITLNEANNWTYSVYIAPGLIVDDEVLEHGYDFSITEPGIDYHYDLIKEIINPMVIDGVGRYLGDGKVLSGEEVEGYIDQSLTAVNRVKSGIDVKKVVYGTDGTTEIYPETEFTITGKLLGPDGSPYTWANGDSVDNSGAYHKYDRNGNRIVYKGHFADSSNISFTLKAGEYVRFINVPEGCTFEFTEADANMPSGYEWKSTVATTQHRVEAGGAFTQEGDVQPTVSGHTASVSKNNDGTGGVVGDKQYSVTFTNQRMATVPTFELVKIDAEDNTLKLNAAEFKLYSNAELTQQVTQDADGNPIPAVLVTGNKESTGGPDGWANIGSLGAGTYYLVETKAPGQHDANETPIVISVTLNSKTRTYNVTATQGGKDVLTYDSVAAVYTITVENPRSTKWVRFKKVSNASRTVALGGAAFDFYNGSETIRLTSDETTGYLTDSEGNDEFELRMSDEAYTLIEITPPDGYKRITDDISVYLQVDSEESPVVVNPTSAILGAVTGQGTQANPYTIAIPNSSGETLPMTGGPGTAPFTILGTAIVVMAILAYGLLSRRTSERRSMS